MFIDIYHVQDGLSIPILCIVTVCVVVLGEKAGCGKAVE
jgi:hypothetical protein